MWLPGGARRWLPSEIYVLRPMGLKRSLARAIFHGWGWKVTGPLPYDTPKCIVVVYPHTSNWDFPVGVLYRPSYDMEINWVGKHTLFQGLMGPFMRWMGGRAVVRTGNTKFVDAVAEVFRQNPVFRLCITPEGTRSKVTELKSGFHYLALAANVPIVWCAFHWDRKEMRWSEPFWPTDDYQESLNAFHDFFRGTVGYHPELAYPIPPLDTEQA